MTTIRKFCCNDLLRIAELNFDYNTLTPDMELFMRWMINWPDYFMIAEAPGNRIMGYFVGGVEEEEGGQHWHGLLASVTVRAEYRRWKLATKLMKLFENQLLEKIRLAESVGVYCVHLYCGLANTPAIQMFTKLGYAVYGLHADFYSDRTAALDMRKILEEEVPGFRWHS